VSLVLVCANDAKTKKMVILRMFSGVRIHTTYVAFYDGLLCFKFSREYPSVLPKMVGLECI
jgi:hypothetical protein